MATLMHQTLVECNPEIHKKNYKLDGVDQHLQRQCTKYSYFESLCSTHIFTPLCNSITRLSIAQGSYSNP